MLFVDASALVKLYVSEPGSEVVERALDCADSVAVCWLSYAECLAAFHRRARDKSLTANELDAIVERFNQDWQKVNVVLETAALEPLISALVARQPLRGADTVQLAAALHLRANGVSLELLCFDHKLANMAREEGLAVIE